MKKRYSFLMTLACLTGSVFSQYVVQAPLYDGSSTRISAPSGVGTQKFQRSVFLVPQGEFSLMALTNSVVTGFGFDMRYGAEGNAVTGNFTVYVENTSDVTYNKGTNFTSAITTMTNVYSGTMTIPHATGGTTMGVTLGTPFTYTGGGVYVAYDWACAAANDPVGAWTLANSTGISPAGARTEGPLPAVATMTVTDFCPVFRFVTGNQAANDIQVVRMDAPGIISKIANLPQVVTTEIKNLSAGPQTNITVSLTVTGANPFSNTQTITTLASGASTVVSFAPYNPLASGMSTLIVLTGTDDNILNNAYGLTQSVTCSEMANNPPVAAVTFSDNALGVTSGAGIISNKYTAPATCSLAGIKLAMGNTTINIGKQVYGVLMDNTGSIIGTSTNTITVTGAQLGAFVTFNNFQPTQDLTAGNDYYLGVAIPAGPMYPAGTAVFDPYVSAPDYYFSGINGGVLSPVDRGNMGIQAVLSYSATLLTVSASQTILCKNDAGVTVTLTATGPDTFTWTPGNFHGNEIVVTPTVATASGNLNYNVTGTDAGSGCRSNAAVVSVSISSCLSIASNSSDGYNINLFPNPSANGKSTITGLVGTNEIVVINTIGQVVLTQKVTEESTSIDLSNQPAGNYIVKIANNNGEFRIIKVMNQKW